MKFLIITCDGSYTIEAEDFEDASWKIYDNVQAIVKLPEEEQEKKNETLTY